MYPQQNFWWLRTVEFSLSGFDDFHKGEEEKRQTYWKRDDMQKCIIPYAEIKI